MVRPLCTSLGRQVRLDSQRDLGGVAEHVVRQLEEVPESPAKSWSKAIRYRGRVCPPFPGTRRWPSESSAVEPCCGVVGAGG
ncbi:MAG: hypothetical protein QOF35_594, partial [Actinomycetota bacterium]|nr:hypothetical protein [Actinomycetota bacterium]